MGGGEPVCTATSRMHSELHTRIDSKPTSLLNYRLRSGHTHLLRASAFDSWRSDHLAPPRSERCLTTSTSTATPLSSS